MGYYTRHSLTVRGEALQNADAAHRILAELNEWLAARDVIGCALCYGDLLTYGGKFQTEIFFECPDEAKRNEHDKDMTACSLAFPELTFCLHGEGEDDFDYWDCYYHDGKSEECRVQWSMPEPTYIKWEYRKEHHHEQEWPRQPVLCPPERSCNRCLQRLRR